MRKNQKGFTLVELIIAVAIMAIVTLAVCGFIVVGSRSYTSANTDIMLQQEAQLALNQISDVIIDTTDSINYGNGTETVLKDSEFNSEPDQKILVVVNKKDGNNDNDSYRFEWSKTDETIYFNTSDDANPDPDFDDTKRAILAQHVKEFHIDISQFEENRVVMISMTFENGNKEYTTSNNVTVRNRIALNKIDVAPMKKAQEFTITTKPDVTLEPGDTYNLGAKTQIDTTADKAEDKEVVWELVDSSTTTSTISADGMLSIGINETRKWFAVRVRRAKEEYANQNNKVAQIVKVNIKRVTGVNLPRPETTIKAGNSVTVDGNAVGNLLTNFCDVCGLSDDVKKDYDLSGWRIVRGPAVIESAGTREATVKILSTAKVGDEIEIEATSDLSARKDYDDVKGTLILKVTEGTMGDMPLQKGFKYGTVDDPGPLIYMREPYLKTDYWQYVMCVRVREQNSTDASNDKVVMYLTGGADVRFFPDLFGLDLNRDYNVFFQVLDPVSKETREKKANNQIGSYFEDPADVIVKEYLENLDPITGKYIGDKYEAAPQFGGILSQPKIEVGYNGIKYPNDDKDYYETYSFFTKYGKNSETVMGRPWLGDVENVSRNGVLNSIMFTVYKGEGDDPAGWERIYGYDAEALQYDSGSSMLPGGAVYVDVESNQQGVSSQFLKWNQNAQNVNLSEACGTYHIVPGYAYANDLHIRDFNYIYISENLKDRDFEKHYYEQPECAITLKVSLGFNMELIPENNEKRWCLFPVPSSPDFPFKEVAGEQTSSQGFAVYSESGNKVNDFWGIPVKCTYDSGVYKIEFTLEAWNVPAVTYTYTCKAGDEQWTLQRVIK